MGAAYIRGRVARIEEKDDGDLILHYEDVDNGGVPATAEYDLVVLAVGVRPNREAAALFPVGELALDDHSYVDEPVDLDPGVTNLPGVFVAGTAVGPKDIPESILHAGAAVAQVAAHLRRRDEHVQVGGPTVTGDSGRNTGQEHVVEEVLS